jgi:hypothetical protein
MPELLETSRQRQLAPGDVLMVEMTLRKSRRPWKFFLVVVRHKRWLVEGRRIGASTGKEEMKLSWENIVKIHYLAPEEWPTGVLAFRMGMILMRLIPDIV